jgi:hypothetical protein
MKFVPAVTAAALLLSLLACATPGNERYAGNVIAVHPEAVIQCKFLDDLSGNSGLAGLFGPKGVDNIKQHLLKEADTKGATHVVWDKANVGYMSTTLSGKAYKCPPTSN